MIAKVNVMAYSVDWYIKDELLYVRFSGKVTYVSVF
jgi:hypothetical protein